MKQRNSTVLMMAATLLLLLAGCGSSTKTVYKTLNQVPLADAGENQVVLTGTTVTLDGSGSLDIEASDLTYNWSIASTPAGSSVSLSDTTIVSPQFTPDLNGDYIISLKVNDGSDDSAESNVTVTASNLPDLSIVIDSVLSENLAVRFNYTVTNQGAVTLTNPSNYNVSFWSDAAVQPNLNDTNVTCSITLSAILSPNETHSGTLLCPDIAQVGTAYAGVDVGAAIDEVYETNNMSPAFEWAFINVAPLVDAGPDKSNFLVGILSRLSASASDLNLDDTLTYSWSVLSAPAGSSSLLLTDESTLTPGFTPDVAGEYVLSFTANDGTLESVASTLHYSAIDFGTDFSIDTPLSIPAYSELPIEINSTITVAGGVASVQQVRVFVDIDHTRDFDLQFFLIAPDGTRVALSAGNGGWADNYTNTLFDDFATESIVSGLAPFNGVYIPQESLSGVNGQPADGNWTLNIIDVYGFSAGGTLKSWAIDLSDVIPLRVNAGINQTAAQGNLVQLDGSGSTGVSSYSWSFVSTPVGSTAVLSDATIVNPTFTPDLTGTYVVELNVSDGVDTLSETVSIGVFSNVTSFSSSAVIAIPLADPAGASSPIVVNSAGAAAKVVVTANITHTWDADLSLYLISPSGTQVALSLEHGGSSDNYTATVFEDNATVAIADGTAPFTGSFIPDAPLSTMIGEDINGTWTLWAVDIIAADTGTIDSWDLTLFY